MSLILRNTKGSALTHTELDDNFSYLDTKIDSVALIANDPSTTGTSSSGSTFMDIQYGYMSAIITSIAPSTFVAFATNTSNGTLDYTAKVDDSTIFIKAGTLYKFEGQIAAMQDDDPSFAAGVAFGLYSDIAGNNLIKPVDYGYEYLNVTTNLIRAYSSIGYIKSDVDCYLKCKFDVATIADSSGISLSIRNTLTKYNTTPILTDANGSYTQGAQELPGYSATETLTEKRWINGKPVYRRVVYLASNPIADGVWHTIAFTGVNTSVIETFISTQSPNSDSDVSMSAQKQFYFTVNGLTYVLFSGGNTLGYSTTTPIIIEYTKTTDTAGSPVALVGGVQDSYVSKFVGCSVLSSGTQTIPSATWTKITSLTNKEYDTASSFDTMTQRFTAPNSGYYKVTGSASNSQSISGTIAINLYKNGLNYRGLNETGSVTTIRGVTGSTELYLNKGDYLELYVYISGGTSPVLSSVVFQVSLIAPNYGGQNTLPNYSTTETLTSERWIDGKPIYKKVVTLPTLVGDNVWRSYAVASGLNTERVLKTHLVSGDGVTYYPDMVAGTLWLRNWVISKNAIDGQFGTNIINNLNGGYIVYEYTKTTDTASSPVTTIGGGGTPKKYYARIKNSVATTINRTQGTVLIPLNTFVKGDAELSNGTTGFIAPQDDVYTIDFNFRSNNALNINITNVYAYIIINGVTDTDYMQCANSTGDRSITGSASFKLNKNDIVTFKLAVFASDTTSALQVPIGSFVANIRN